MTTLTAVSNQKVFIVRSQPADIWKQQAGICVSPYDRDLIVWGETDGSVKTWDLKTNGVTQWDEAKSSVSCVHDIQVMDEEICTSLHEDGIFRIWDMNTAHIKGYFNVNDKGVSRLARLDSTKIVAAGVNDRYKDSHQMQIVDLNKKVIKVFANEHQDMINALVPIDQNVWISGSSDATMKIWDSRMQATTSSFGEKNHRVHDLVMPNNTTLISTSLNETSIKVWDWRNRSCMKTITDNQSGYTLAMFDSITLISGSRTGELEFWDWNSGQLRSRYKAIEFSPDDFTIVDGAVYPREKVNAFMRGNCTAELEPISRLITHLKAISDRVFLVKVAGKPLEVWDFTQ